MGGDEFIELDDGQMMEISHGKAAGFCSNCTGLTTPRAPTFTLNHLYCYSLGLNYDGHGEMISELSL